MKWAFREESSILHKLKKRLFWINKNLGGFFLWCLTNFLLIKNQFSQVTKFCYDKKKNKRIPISSCNLFCFRHLVLHLSLFPLNYSLLLSLMAIVNLVMFSLQTIYQVWRHLTSTAYKPLWVMYYQFQISNLHNLNRKHVSTSTCCQQQTQVAINRT